MSPSSSASAGGGNNSDAHLPSEGNNLFPPSLALTILSFAALLRTLVAYHPHSGQDNHHGSLTAYGGDYEAQRHWMELTLNVPMGEWYAYNLTYWGLDYPPLTAYVSYVCGWVGREVFGGVCAEGVALGTSRGYEDGTFKAYMRGTVLALDMAVYWTAVWAIGRRMARSRRVGSGGWLVAMALAQPAIVLIDHGHFQYNTVSLGLALWSFHFMTLGGSDGRPAFLHCVTGSVLFSLSLNFKQMSLYYAPAVFAYLLGRCFESSLGEGGGGGRFLWRFLSLGTAVIITFMTQWLPFVLWRSPGASPSEAAMAIVRRLFPFQRGLFEGKVSNIWCALSTRPVSIRERIPEDLLPMLALVLTLFLAMPGCVALFDVGRRGRGRVEAVRKKDSGRGEGSGVALIAMKEEDAHLRYLLWGTTACSLSFFLASFQVHEKGILMAVAPLSMLWLDRPAFVTWFSLAAAWTLWPLLLVDRLEVAYLLTMAIFGALVVLSGEAEAEVERCFLRISEGKWSFRGAALPSSEWAVIVAPLATAMGMLGLHAAEWVVDVPASLPDLFPVLWSVAGCGMFCWSWLCCSVVMFADSDAVLSQERTYPLSRQAVGKQKDD